MKLAKRISLFFIYPMVIFLVGFLGGMWTIRFFYPGMVQENRMDSQENRQGSFEHNETMEAEPPEDSKVQVLEEEINEPVQNVAAIEETLNADTEYVLQERDLLKDTVVETVWKIPGKYIGMNRELFVESMEEYETNPPLSEVERGFVGLEILSFSPKRVVVQMNYEYVQPSESFYLVVQDNEVVVLLEDMETVFINTGIMLENLPELIQMQIIQMYYIENEEVLYNFLETYSS